MKARKTESDTPLHRGPEAHKAAPTRTDLASPAADRRSPKEVLIVGAGPGGLATAILLASSGVRVRILERLPMIGGRTSRIEAEGFRFDLGPTFFLYPRVLEEIFPAA